MDFIKILGDIIEEQSEVLSEQQFNSVEDAESNGWSLDRPDDYSSNTHKVIDIDGFKLYKIISGGAVAGATQGAQAGSQSGGSSRGGTSHSWKPGSKIDSPLKNPGKCNKYHQWRQYYNGGRGDYHDACDIPVPSGTALFAPYDGTFIEVDNSACGNGIDLTGEVDGKKLYSRFCHLRNREVPSDGKVKKGDLIGFTGGGKKYGSSTEYEPGAGNTTGPHLHWTFKVDGRKTNGYTYN